MKATEFIRQLQGLIEKHGDQEVNVFDPDKLEEGEMIETAASITLHCNEDDVVDGFTITDQETAYGFL